jgi:hypothetical protein
LFPDRLTEGNHDFFEKSLGPQRAAPVGAKYVVEGHGGAEGRLRVVARYIELPGGRRINISGSRALSFDRSRGSQALRTQSKIRGGTTVKKFAGKRGTPARASR